MILHRGQLCSKYIMQSDLRHDLPTIFGIPYSMISKWDGKSVARRLVDAGLAKICEQTTRGEILSMHVDNLTVEQVEAVCLDDAAREKIAKLKKRGLVCEK